MSRLTDKELQKMIDRCVMSGISGLTDSARARLSEMLRDLTDLLPAPTIGDVVRRIDGQPLRNGSEAYSTAVVVSQEPFALVRDRMVWEHTVDRRFFAVERRAERRELQEAFARWSRWKNLKWPKLKRDWPGCLVTLLEDKANGRGKYEGGSLWRVVYYYKGLDLKEHLPCPSCRKYGAIGRVSPGDTALVYVPPRVRVRCKSCDHVIQGSAQKNGKPNYRCPKCNYGYDEQSWELC